MGSRSGGISARQRQPCSIRSKETVKGTAGCWHLSLHPHVHNFFKVEESNAMSSAVVGGSVFTGLRQVVIVKRLSLQPVCLVKTVVVRQQLKVARCHDVTLCSMKELGRVKVAGGSVRRRKPIRDSWRSGVLNWRKCRNWV